jgi:hypothetical protein
MTSSFSGLASLASVLLQKFQQSQKKRISQSG